MPQRTCNLNAFLLALCLLIAAPLAGADVAMLQTRWAQVMYETPEASREAEFAALADEARKAAAEHPDDPETLIWQGIILSTYAGEAGGLSALGLVKEARNSLESALAMDEAALQGSAHASLGTLYYKVPGWPIGFGSNKKAKEHLERALAMNPEGIDPNYFMAEFLVERGKSDQARRYLLAALDAPPRPDRPLADTGRRQEVKALLSKIDR